MDDLRLQRFQEGNYLPLSRIGMQVGRTLVRRLDTQMHALARGRV